MTFLVFYTVTTVLKPPPALESLKISVPSIDNHMQQYMIPIPGYYKTGSSDPEHLFWFTRVGTIVK
jgi:hypothetical protein